MSHEPILCRRLIPDITELDFPKIDGKQYATLTHATVKVDDMGEKTITTQVRIDGGIVPDFSRDWAVEFQGEKYIMPLRIPQGEIGETLDSTVDLTFQHWAVYQLKRWNFVTIQPIETGTAIADEEVASVESNLKDFCALFGQVLKYHYGDSITIDFNDDPDTGWQYDPEPVRIEISHTKVWDVLVDAFHDKYGVRWEIKAATNNSNTVKGGERYVIRVGYPTTEVGHIFEQGFEGGLLKLTRQVQSEEIRNMLNGRGGETNIPLRYFKDTDPDNKDFRPDPDWVEELANIYFPNLRGATFRSYVQGWKAAHISKYPGYKAVGEGNAYAPWAYRKGYTDTKFHPVEFVADEITVSPQTGDRQVDILPDYSPHVKKDSSLDKYGPLAGTLDNNDEIYPTIQGSGMDVAVAVEQIQSDDVEESAESDAQVEDLEFLPITVASVSPGYGTATRVGAYTYFKVEAGKRANLEGTASAKAYRPSDHADRSQLIAGLGYTIRVVNTDTGETHGASGIPPGNWYFTVDFTFQNTGSEKLAVTCSLDEVKLTSATPDDKWRDTFDIWVKNIWETAKDTGETDTQYAERVWKPILGDREGNKAKVVFTTGALAHEDYEFTIVDFPVYDDSQSFEGEDSHWRIKLGKSEAELEATGLYVPSTRKQGQAGDRFAFIGTEMTHHYTLWAEKALDDWKKDRLGETKEIKPTLVITTDRVRLNGEGKPDALINRLRAGNSIRVADKRFIQPMGDRAYETLYLQSITYTYREPSSDDAALNPDVEIVLGDEYATSANPVSTMQGEISSMQRMLGSISNVEQIVRAVGDKLYMRKDGIPDRSLSPTQFFSLLTSGDFRSGIVGGAGWGFFKDASGQWTLEVPRLNIRGQMQVNNLVINQISARGGMTVESAAAMEITETETMDDGDILCRFDTRRGTVANLFHRFDVALCHRYTPENGELKYYRRLVNDVGEDYVILSGDMGDGDGWPDAGDVIVQFGNEDDTERQCVIVRDVIGGGYERFIEGLDSLYAEGREYVFIGRKDGESPRFFVGNKEAGQYIEYKDGRFVVSGELKVDGQPFPDYLAENTDSTNLLLKTVDFKDSTVWFGTIRVYTDSGEDWQGVTTYRMSSNFSPVQVFGDAVPGEKYTFSAWVKVEGDAMPGQARLATFTPGDPYVPVAGAEAQSYSVLADLALGEWRRVKATFTAPADGKLCIGLRLYNASATVTRIGGFKLEKGEIATSWAPAPSDNDTSKFEYLRDAMRQNTEINGGLVQTSTVILGQRNSDESYTVWSGTNGRYRDGKTPAFFAGGDMIDLEYGTYSTEDRPATYLIRMDGTGYASGGVVRFTASSMRVGEYAYMNKDGFSIVGNDGTDILRLSNMPIGTIDELSNAAVTTRYISAISRNLDVNYGKEGFGISFSGSTSQKITLTLGNIQPGQKLSAQLSVFLYLGNIDFNIPSDPFALYVYPNLVVEVVRTSDGEVVYRSTHRVQPAAHGSDVLIIDDILFRCDAEAASVHQLRVGFDMAVTSSETHATASMRWARTPAFVYTYSKKQTLLGNNGFASAWGETLVFADADQILLRAGNFNFRIHKDSGFGYNTDGSATFKSPGWT